MTIGRAISQQIPVCPGRDSRHSIRHNHSEPGDPWWVFYQDTDLNLIPSDDPHTDLVELVNLLKEQQGNQLGGGFSINEHGQVIARMQAPPGYGGQSIHVVGVLAGNVRTYTTPITFQGGVLDPRVSVSEGDDWPGPLCGMSYTFAAPGNPKQPSRNYNEIWTEIGGQVRLLSAEAAITPYPPAAGPLAEFLSALRRQCPNGGRFRVNEWGRAFTSDGSIFVGTIPAGQWFQPITATS
jgi:hypothetical protein